jgi:uncharacterized membrane protein
MVSFAQTLSLQDGSLMALLIVVMMRDVESAAPHPTSHLITALSNTDLISRMAYGGNHGCHFSLK